MCIENLDSSISKDGNALSIKRYSIIRVDHPSNTKKGGACIYYNETISVTQCLACEFVIENNKGHLSNTLQVKIKVDLNIFWDKIWIEIKLSPENRSGNIRNHDPAFTI